MLKSAKKGSWLLLIPVDSPTRGNVIRTPTRRFTLFPPHPNQAPCSLGIRKITAKHSPEGCRDLCFCNSRLAVGISAYIYRFQILIFRGMTHRESPDCTSIKLPGPSLWSPAAIRNLPPLTLIGAKGNRAHRPPRITVAARYSRAKLHVFNN